MAAVYSGRTARWALTAALERFRCAWRVAPADDLTTKFGWTALADAVGILFIAPLALQPAVDLLRGLRKRAALAALGLVALLSVVLFHGVSSEAARMALAGVMFPLLLLVEVRGGPAATSVGLGVLGLAGLVAILLRRGPFAPTAHESALVFRVYEPSPPSRRWSWQAPWPSAGKPTRRWSCTFSRRTARRTRCSWSRVGAASSGPTRHDLTVAPHCCVRNTRYPVVVAGIGILLDHTGIPG